MTSTLTLVLCRHGHAEHFGPDPGLSERGRAAVRARRDALAQLAVDAVLASPLRRAQETADLLAAAWPEAERATLAELVPEGSPAQAAQRLLGCAPPQPATLLVVAHLPLLPALRGWFTGAAAHFEPADAVCLASEAALAWQGTFSVVDVASVVRGAWRSGPTP